MLLGSQLVILTPEVNQSSDVRSGNYSSLVSLSVQDVKILSCMIRQKTIPSQVGIWIQTNQDVLRPVREVKPTTFFALFSGFLSPIPVAAHQS